MARSRAAFTVPEQSEPSVHGAATQIPSALPPLPNPAGFEPYPRCNLCEERKTVIVGEGNPRAELVFIGEAPGEQEKREGRPFTGPAGELLDKMILAMGLTRDQVYISNLVKSHAPGNRDSELSELDVIAPCVPYLKRQLDAIQPKVIVALGEFTAQALLQSDSPISSLRGRFHEYALAGSDRAKLMPTFHPTYLLRNPEAKREAWADLQAVARELGLALPTTTQKKPQSKG